MEYALEMIGLDYLRYKRTVQAICAELQQLPQGNLTYRTIKGHRYCYLQFRDKQGVVRNKIVSQKDIPETEKLLRRRRFLQENLHLYETHIHLHEKAYPQLKDLNDFLPNKDAQKLYLTLKGEYVRSKSEVIIANELFNHQILYEYEKPLTLKGYPHPIYPDFTIYTPREGKTVYWEHSGLMNNPEYCSKWDWKLHLYAENGISVWQKNLIVTYESQPGDFSMGEIVQRIRELS